jgi:hypothetical protein
MFSKIVMHTPFWVWILLAGLIALGYSQTRSRTIGLARSVVIPVVMVLLSLYGTVSAFSLSSKVLSAWFAACVLLASSVVLRPAPAGTLYDSVRHQFAVPGSWLPLFVILGIFCTKYAVGVTLAMQPSMAHHTLFATSVGMLYGLFSGFFAGRALRLWRMVLPGSAHLLLTKYPYRSGTVSNLD